MQTYDTDLNAWANEQVRLLRAGRFDLLDIEHLAGETEDVGKSEQRELASRMAVLCWHTGGQRNRAGCLPRGVSVGGAR